MDVVLLGKHVVEHRDVLPQLDVHAYAIRKNKYMGYELPYHVMSVTNRTTNKVNKKIKNLSTLNGTVNLDS